MSDEIKKRFDDEETFLPPGSRGSPSAATGAAVGLAPSSGFTSSYPKLQKGRVIANRYKILELLGQGGMGAVYKAQDRELGRAIAIKTIRTDLAENAEVLQRFKQEIIVARQVTHKN